MKSLIHDSENGLLSRFIFFCINAIDNWLDGFDSYGGDKPLEESFDALGEEFSAFAKQLEGTPKILFKLSLPQTGRFNDYFKIEKTKMKELNGDRYSASTHRLAWCFLRIVMILTALRMMDSGVVTERVECADVDFETTMEIIKVISAHNDYIFNVLDRERPEGIAVADSYSAATCKTILAALPGYFKTEDMKDIAAKIANGSATGRASDSGRGGGAGEARRVQEGIGRRREPGLSF